MRALVLACLVACASNAQHPAQNAAPLESARAPDTHAQIDQLAKQIDDDRTKLALAAPPPSPALVEAKPFDAPVSSKTDEQCRPAASQTCTDTCTLADAICGNAQKICELASQLAGDGWAAQKCDSAKHTCDDAHAKCCACQ